MVDTPTPNYGWIMPGDHQNTDGWGALLNQDITSIDAKVFSIESKTNALTGAGTTTAPVTSLTLSRTATTAATILFKNSAVATSNQMRWAFIEDTVAEGANAGSNFFLKAYSDTGALLPTVPITVTRANGAVAFGGSISVAGSATFSSTLSCATQFSVSSTGPSGNATVGFYNSAGTRQGYVGWLPGTDLVELSADGGANIQLNGGIALNGAVIASDVVQADRVSARSTTTASAFQDITARNITASGVAASGAVSGATVTSTGAMTCGTALTVNSGVNCANNAGAILSVNQGQVTIKQGATTRPTLSFFDNSSIRGNVIYDPATFGGATGRIIINEVNSGSAIWLDGAGVFNFTGSSALKVGGGSWGNFTSDARAKTVKGEYEPGLDEVLQLRPVVYSYKGNDAAPGEQSPTKQVEGKEFVGLIAQEVETALPGMVTRREGYIDGQKVNDFRSLDTSELIFALVNAVKSLKAEIEALKKG